MILENGTIVYSTHEYDGTPKDRPCRVVTPIYWDTLNDEYEDGSYQLAYEGFKRGGQEENFDVDEEAHEDDYCYILEWEDDNGETQITGTGAEYLVKAEEVEEKRAKLAAFNQGARVKIIYNREYSGTPTFPMENTDYFCLGSIESTYRMGLYDNIIVRWDTGKKYEFSAEFALKILALAENEDIQGITEVMLKEDFIIPAGTRLFIDGEYVNDEKYGFFIGKEHLKTEEVKL